MKKLLATAMFSAMIILPAAAVEQQPVKYELGNYSFSFDKQEETQSVELKSTENVVTPEIAPVNQSKVSKPVTLPAPPNGKPVVIDNVKPVAENDNAQVSKPVTLPAPPNGRPVVIDTNIKPVAENIDTQKQVVKQMKQEEQAKETLETIKNEPIETEQPTVAPTVEPQEQNVIEQKPQTPAITEPAVEPAQEPTVAPKKEFETNEEKYEIKTPLPQSSVTPSAEDLKLKTNLPPKTHTPMPTQKVLDETHSVTTGETPVKRVVQPTKAPAKEPQRPVVVEEENLGEITLTKDNQPAQNATNETNTVENADKSAVDNQKDGTKKEGQKVKEKKKLPVTFELQKMQYTGVESRQL